MKLSAFAPVSAGNFIVGFDLLGAAFTDADASAELFGDIVHMETQDAFELCVVGAYAGVLPAAPGDNIVAACVDAYRDALRAEGGIFDPRFRMTLEKRLPVGSGLGSSASSIVAALVALNAWHGQALDKAALLRVAGVMEGRISGGVHYDNVAPSLLGGLQLMLPEGGACRPIPLPPSWRFVIHYPGIEVSTRAARAVLPERYALSEVVRFGQYLAAFVSAAERADEAGMLSALRDELIVPHRAKLVPGFASAQVAAMNAGAKGFGLSGYRLTVLAICDVGSGAAGTAVAAGSPSQRITASVRLSRRSPPR